MREILQFCMKLYLKEVNIGFNGVSATLDVHTHTHIHTWTHIHTHTQIGNIGYVNELFVDNIF